MVILIDDLCIQKALRLRYSLPRLHWLIGTMSLVSLLYLSSEELWNILDSERLPEINLLGFSVYLVFFLSILIAVNYWDIRRFINKKRIAISTALISVVIDLFLICLAELLVLYSIKVIPQDISKGAIMLLIGALPSSLGVIVLTSLTAESLKKRAKTLDNEAKALQKQVEELDEQRKRVDDGLKMLENKKKEFDEYFESKKKEERGEDGR